MGTSNSKLTLLNRGLQKWYEYKTYALLLFLWIAIEGWCWGHYLISSEEELSIWTKKSLVKCYLHQIQKLKGYVLLFHILSWDLSNRLLGIGFPRIFTCDRVAQKTTPVQQKCNSIFFASLVLYVYYIPQFLTFHITYQSNNFYKFWLAQDSVA